ncbi:MAG: YmfQ family protein [Clostridium sp.]|nr:YmfQ family protein [Clostridium sp.]
MAEIIIDKLREFNRHLLDYLPPILQEVQDFQRINAASEPEIRLAWENVGRVLANQFLAEAESSGLSVWERELGLYPKAGEGLAMRRARIKAGWNRKPPYTLRWLRDWLTGLGGEAGHQESIEGYTLNILLDYDLLPEPNKLVQEILGLLLSIRPANMLVQIEAQAVCSFAAYGGAACCGQMVEAGAVAEIF